MSTQEVSTHRSWWKYILVVSVLLGSAFVIINQSPSMQLGASGAPTATPTVKDPEAVNAGPLIDFSVQDLSNQTVQLSDHLGNVVLVNFWATWCSPCREEMPLLENYYFTHQDQGFVLIGINVSGRPEEVAEYIEETGYGFPIWLDPPGNILIDLKVNGLPASLLVDREGHLVKKWIGPLTEEVLENEITPLLGSSSP